jgi:hypothetical protein
MKERKQSLTSILLFKTLDRFSGHSRPLDNNTSPNTYPLRRRQSAPVPSSPTHGRRIERYEPPPPLSQHIPPRTHCLTPPRFEISTEEPVVLHEQIQSPLLNLPKEVLLMIYERVVGIRVLHIVRRRDKLGHTLCISTGEPDDCKEAKCRGLKLPTGLYARSGHGSGDLIQLLQTCRKV